MRLIQARILGEQLRRWWPDIPRAVIGKREHVASLAQAGWQVIAPDDPRLIQGFESKLELWRYSPFAQTLFLDADILPLMPMGDLRESIKGLMACPAPVSFYGRWMQGDDDYQGTIVGPLRAHGIERLWATVAGGHYFWRHGPESEKIFTLAAAIGREKWPEIVRYLPVLNRWFQASDETLVSIALARLYPNADFPPEEVICWSRLWSPSQTSIKYLHFMADLNPGLYVRVARSGGASWFRCGWFLLQWTWKMFRKLVLHYWYGGSRRIKSTLQMAPNPAQPGQPASELPADPKS